MWNIVKLILILLKILTFVYEMLILMIYFTTPQVKCEVYALVTFVFLCVTPLFHQQTLNVLAGVRAVPEYCHNRFNF